MTTVLIRAAVVAMALLSVTVQIVSAAQCIKRRKWKLAALALVGIFRVRLDWSAPQIMMEWLSITLLGVSADWGGGELFIGVSFPGGALLARELLQKPRQS